jgi:hypothetical protein
MAGWIFMSFSLSFVLALAIWCYAKVLSVKKEPAQPTKDFHSA